MESLKEKVASLPTQPGVYFMKNKQGQIIYVGKAKNLKRRVSSYFVQNKQHSRKTKEMISQIKDFDFQLVDTEFDALLVELQNIHQIRPRYNRSMNHYEEYGYFQLLNRSPYLRVLTEWSDEHLVLGPFYKKSKMLTFREIVNSVYHLDGPLRDVRGIVRDFSEVTPQEDLALRVDEIRETLLGRSNMFLERIQQKVDQANQRNDFEAAAQWWNNYLLVQRFLRRNRQLLAAANDNVFVGILAENGQYYCYLYAKGQILQRVVYTRKPKPEQAHRRLMKDTRKKDWSLLAQKVYLNKQDVDLFPLFFNYLNRNGEIHFFEWPNA
ncbi:nucleotide excision repair endonuclease [Enterococcus florum]|uniref:Nucleotide excision repair endonuclease n=1 Tax=Enterococcus florum TaxID=2480627 RepID=A0A4P5P8K1_9ENTE|nr:GIY-YIG nuclease family protein [Enterococcus florum]GCF92604.1 nucleotide excision repair endonuclease [Enterococcus florum]